MAHICDHFPCHDNNDFFSCEYCYCPLYEKDCKIFGGNPIFIIDKTTTNIKDCSDCIFPHTKEFVKNYEKKFQEF